jgi:hypothetical protein
LTPKLKAAVPVQEGFIYLSGRDRIHDCIVPLHAFMHMHTHTPQLFNTMKGPGRTQMEMIDNRGDHQDEQNEDAYDAAAG